MRLLLVLILLVSLPPEKIAGGSSMRSLRTRANLRAAMAAFLRTVIEREHRADEIVLRQLKPRTRVEAWRNWRLLGVLKQRRSKGTIKGPITAQSFQRFQNAGTIPLNVANGSGELQIKTPRPIVAIHFFGSVAITIGTGAGVVEDAIQRYFRQFSITQGGEPRFTIGDGSAGSSAVQMLESVERCWGQTVPHITQVTAASTTSLVHISSPVSVPTNRYSSDAVKRSALRIGNDSSWRIGADNGSIADLITTPGTATVDAGTQVEVLLEVDDELGLTYPAGSFDLYSNFENLSLLTAGTNRIEKLSANGVVLFIALQQRENSLRSRAICTNLQYRVNGSQIVSDGSWNLYEWILEKFGAGAANAPTGRAAVILDNRFNLAGIPAAGATGWDALPTNTAGTNAASDGLNMQTYYYIARK